MERKPIVAVNADFRPAAKDTPAFTYVAAGYYDAITKVGGIPFILPPLASADDIAQILGTVDAVVLVGGADLDPRRDGYMLHPTVRAQDPRREIFDRQLAKEVIARRIPVFGIGSGMQLINVAMGGNLFLHLPEDMPGALPHKDPIDPEHRHGLNIAPNSLMERVYGDGEIRVNSMHHMAVDEIAPGLRVTARCPDGVIEAFEGKDQDWFILGTQFHPEANSASALDLRIFEEFLIGAVGEYVSQVRLVA